MKFQELRKGLEHVPLKYREALSELLAFLKDKLRENLISVVVFGSVARGTFKEHSDVDLLVVSRNFPKKLVDRIDLFVDKTFEISMKYGINTSIIPLKIDEAQSTQPIYLDMAYEGIILYDKNNFIEKTKRSERETEQDGSRKGPL
ncbi:MAG: nucleotidyltransferase domain-containing protein [Candidatus Baldrarchaeia archaeon]